MRTTTQEDTVSNLIYMTARLTEKKIVISNRKLSDISALTIVFLCGFASVMRNIVLNGESQARKPLNFSLVLAFDYNERIKWMIYIPSTHEKFNFDSFMFP